MADFSNAPRYRELEAPTYRGLPGTYREIFTQPLERVPFVILEERARERRVRSEIVRELEVEIRRKLDETQRECRELRERELRLIQTLERLVNRLAAAECARVSEKRSVAAQTMTLEQSSKSTQTE